MKAFKNKEHEKFLTLIEKEEIIYLKYDRKITKIKNRLRIDTDIELLFTFSKYIALKNFLKNFYKSCHNIIKKSKYYDKIKVLRVELKNRPKYLNDSVNRQFYRYKSKLLNEVVNKLTNDGWSINEIYNLCFCDF